FAHPGYTPFYDRSPHERSDMRVGRSGEIWIEDPAVLDDADAIELEARTAQCDVEMQRRRVLAAQIAVLAQRQQDAAVDRARLGAACAIGAAGGQYVPACTVVGTPADMGNAPAILQILGCEQVAQHDRFTAALDRGGDTLVELD